jgi:3-deoxy-manno-octulosonate cytidylyltransferase (CMP-KDO synthetase)
MIEHVYRRTATARGIDAVIVATDDVRVAAVVREFGGVAHVTEGVCRTGTDRVADVARHLRCEILVNVQGDEPLIESASVEEVIAPLLADSRVHMCTVRRRIDDPAECTSPHVVKVVVNLAGDALYFSRASIPHVPVHGGRCVPLYKHIGLYAYRRDFLLSLAALPQTPLELAESLEQLRALEHGFRIRTVETQFDSIGVDTPEDLERVRRQLMAAPRA